MEDPVLYVYYDVVTDNEMEKMKKNSLNSVKGFKIRPRGEEGGTSGLLTIKNECHLPTTVQGHPARDQQGRPVGIHIVR